MSEAKFLKVYIFASLFCKSEGEHLWNKDCFLFRFESSFRSWNNQIWTFQIFKCYDVIKYLILLNNLGSKNSLVIKLGSVCKFQRILCKKKPEEICKLIWRNFDSFAMHI